MRAPATTTLAGSAGIIGALLAWHVVSVTDTVDRTSFPPPLEVASALVHVLGDGAFLSALGETAESTILGLLISVAIALPLGAALGLSEAAFRSTRLVIEFLKPIPVVALLPLALLMYGTTLQMKLVLIVFGTLWPLLMQVVYGVQNVDAVAAETARAYRLRRHRRIVSLVLPSAAPFIATGLRVAGVTALLLSIVTELVGGAAGLGLQITRAQPAADFDELYALVVITGVLGIAVNAALRRVERRTLRWHPAHREAADEAAPAHRGARAVAADPRRRAVVDREREQPVALLPAAADDPRALRRHVPGPGGRRDAATEPDPLRRRLRDRRRRGSRRRRADRHEPVGGRGARPARAVLPCAAAARPAAVRDHRARHRVGDEDVDHRLRVAVPDPAQRDRRGARDRRDGARRPARVPRAAPARHRVGDRAGRLAADHGGPPRRPADGDPDDGRQRARRVDRRDGNRRARDRRAHMSAISNCWIVLNAAFTLVERRVLRWYAATHGGGVR